MSWDANSIFLLLSVILSFYLVFYIKSNIIKISEDIIKLQEKVIERNHYIAYETNVSSINNVNSGIFYLDFNNSNLYII